MSDNNSNSGGVGFFGWLVLLFIALKLTGYIEWSWWWVLSPLWVPLSIGFGLLGVGLCLELLKIYKR